jgi:opacity protein-like surface antigen
MHPNTKSQNGASFAMRHLESCIRLSFAAVCVLLFVNLAVSQDDHKFNFSAGGGFTVPNGRSGLYLNNGGYNVSQYFLADLDFAFDRSNLSSLALARAGQPGGYADVWSLTFAPMVRLTPRSPVGVYLIGGAGLYHRGLNFTQPATFTSFGCDPFFGYCYPVTVSGNQVVASYSTYKFGYNAGAGLEFKIGQTGLRAFAEARYNEMFTSRGKNLTYTPATFGIRW